MRLGINDSRLNKPHREILIFIVEQLLSQYGHLHVAFVLGKSETNIFSVLSV